jgi:hypothetical protein
VIVGIEAPEFPFERDAGNVKSAISQFGINYPVVQDNNLDTWNAWGNEYWPADYLIDANGDVRYAAFGEGDYTKTESAIRVLLAAAGAKGLGGGAKAEHVIVPSAQTSPETYLGTARAQGWVSREPQAGTHTYRVPAGGVLGLSEFAYGGTWTVGPQQALAGLGATITANVQAKNVYIVLSPPPHGTGTVKVSIDGKPASPANAGSDVHNGVVTVTQQRLYNVVAVPSDQEHTLTLSFSPGTSGYSFTFG